MSDLIDDFDPKTGNSKRKWNIYPIYIHIGFILLLLIIILLFLLSDFSPFSQDESRPEISILGDLNNFTIPYNGNIQIETSKHTLTTTSGKFDGRAQEFKVYNYSGNIKLINETMYFRGSGKNITFGTNQINLNGENFILKSPQRTSFTIQLEELDLFFNSGTFKFADSLSYNFEDLNISMKKLNASMNYDGQFSLQGLSDKFKARTKNNIKISYTHPDNSTQK